MPKLNWNWHCATPELSWLATSFPFLLNLCISPFCFKKKNTETKHNHHNVLQQLLPPLDPRYLFTRSSIWPTLTAFLTFCSSSAEVSWAMLCPLMDTTSSFVWSSQTSAALPATSQWSLYNTTNQMFVRALELIQYFIDLKSIPVYLCTHTHINICTYTYFTI